MSAEARKAVRSLEAAWMKAFRAGEPTSALCAISAALRQADAELALVSQAKAGTQIDG
jgi:hypothetical protein